MFQMFIDWKSNKNLINVFEDMQEGGGDCKKQ